MNMETGFEAQPMEECFLLVYFQAQIQQPLSDISGPPAQLHWQYIIHCELDPTILVRNQENIPTDMSTGQQDEHNSSVELPNNRCVRLTELLHHISTSYRFDTKNASIKPKACANRTV